MYNDKQSGVNIIDISVILELTQDNTKVEFGNFLEFSLDCWICSAIYRTIQINENEKYGICTPAKHQFPTKINSKKVHLQANIIEVIYQFEYWYSPFYDRKREKESRVFPTWGRVYFKVTCPKCFKETESSLQTNIIRPWTKYCECGLPLYTEKKIMPTFKKINLKN